MNVKFNDYNCFVKIGHYFNHNKSIQLMDADDGMPVATATINIPDKLQAGEVAIKDYSENEGIYDVLVKNNVIFPMHRLQQTGMVVSPVCFLKGNFSKN